MVSSEPVYDVAIIGGGVMGCAILRELTSKGYRCILLEQHSNFLTGASGGNRLSNIGGSMGAQPAPPRK